MVKSHVSSRVYITLYNKEKELEWIVHNILDNVICKKIVQITKFSFNWSIRKESNYRLTVFCFALY